MSTLAEIKPGNTVLVKGINDSPLKPKLLEMGLIAGREITVLFAAPFGDPIAIDINGSILSLRLDEASSINISRETLSEK